MCGMATHGGIPSEGWFEREAVPFSRIFKQSSLIVEFRSAPPGKGIGGWDRDVKDSGAGFHLEWQAVKI